MDAVDNPYAPGAGLRPPLLAGRAEEIAAFDAILRRGELGRVSRGLVLTGLRGVGKTVLLNEMAERAEARRWLVVQSEARRDGSGALLANVAGQLTAGVRRLHGPRLSEVARRALASITALTLTVDSTGVVSATRLGDRSAAGSGRRPGGRVRRPRGGPGPGRARRRPGHDGGRGRCRPAPGRAAGAGPAEHGGAGRRRARVRAAQPALRGGRGRAAQPGGPPGRGQVVRGEAVRLPPAGTAGPRTSRRRR